MLVLNSCMAYFTNLTNFLVTKHTSALTLQVCSPSLLLLLLPPPPPGSVSLAASPAQLTCAQPRHLACSYAPTRASPCLSGCLAAIKRGGTGKPAIKNWNTPPSCAQVLGNAKGVVAVIVSVLYFRNPVNTYSILGYAITVAGVVLYSQVRMP